MIRRRIVWWLLLLAALVAGRIFREGGCDRTLPDDDRPVPACEPGDKECYGAEPPRPTA